MFGGFQSNWIINNQRDKHTQPFFFIFSDFDHVVSSGCNSNNQLYPPSSKSVNGILGDYALISVFSVVY